MPTLILRPNAAGDETNLDRHGVSANWDAVDDLDLGDGNATYVSNDSGSYVKDLYNLPNHTTQSGEIRSVTLYFKVRGTSSGKCASGAIKTEGQMYVTTDKNPGTAWILYNETWDVNPSTGLAWTWTQIDALQAGIRLKEPGWFNTGRCTQIYVVVQYGGDTTESAASALALSASGSIAKGELFSGSVTGLQAFTPYYFRYKIFANNSWYFAPNTKSFETTGRIQRSATCALGLSPSQSEGGIFARIASLLKLGARTHDNWAIQGEWREVLCCIGAIASSAKGATYARSAALLKMGLRAITFPMGPHRKLLLRLRAVKRFILDLWVKADKCRHRWED